MAGVTIWVRSNNKFTNYSYLSEATVANFQDNEKTSEFHMLIKHCFPIRKIQFKKSKGFISVIQTLLCWKHWLRGGLLTLNAVVPIQIMLNTQVT